MENLTFQAELSKFGVVLHKRIVETLINEIDLAIASGRIRSQDGKNSVFDFVREILEQKAERKVWQRFAENCPDVVTICHYISFVQESGRKGRETPVTDLAGLLVIAYLANCDYSQKLRSASAAYFVTDRIKSHSATSLITPILFQSETPDDRPAKIRERIKQLKTENAAIAIANTELTNAVKDWEHKYRQCYDRMQYFQAKAMGNAMLDRLRNTPDDFSEDSEIVWLISGIADKSYFVARCREDLEYGVDYINGSRRGHLKLTPHGALLMLLNLRSRRGVAVRYMPQKVEIEIPKSICSGKNSKINRRQLQAQ